MSVGWDGAAYAANTAHHRAHDSAFLASLGTGEGDRVLDVGCGVGDLTVRVAGLVGPAGVVVGLDAEPTMVAEARRRALGNQSFVVAAAEELASAVGSTDPFDTVYSRAVLHWLPASAVGDVLSQCLSVLRPGGVLRVECGGGDNVASIVSFLDDVGSSFGRPAGVPWNFRGAGWWLDLLLSVGFVLGEAASSGRSPSAARSIVRRWSAGCRANAYMPTSLRWLSRIGPRSVRWPSPGSTSSGGTTVPTTSRSSGWMRWPTGQSTVSIIAPLYLTALERLREKLRGWARQRR